MDTQTSKRIRRAVERIERCLGEPTSLNDVANAASLSPKSFARMFRSATGQSAMAYLWRRRLSESAVSLAGDRSKPILAIALD